MTGGDSLYKIFRKHLANFRINLFLILIIVSLIPVQATNLNELNKIKNMFVSAENLSFNNTFGGPMVIEVVVIASNLNDLDEQKGELDVTINGNDLRMAQAIDGNWYAYFADKTMATRADETNLKEPEEPENFGDTAGAGLDFGGFCGPSTTDTDIVGSSGGFPQTEGFAIARSFEGGKIKEEDDAEVVPTHATAPFVDCVFIGPLDDPDTLSVYSSGVVNHVVREAKKLNTNNAVEIGQIGLVEETWPIIQLYDFTPNQDVKIIYNEGGNAEFVYLKFDDLEDLSFIKFDNESFPPRAELHITLQDNQLNIDPTDEDSWTFDVNPSTLKTIYQMYDENGNNAAQGNGDAEVDILPDLNSLGYGKNGFLKIIADAQDVGINNLEEDPSSLIVGSPPIIPLNFDVTLVETQANSGIFGTWDWNDNSNIDVTTDAQRGTSAIIEYGGTKYSVLIKNYDATIKMGFNLINEEGFLKTVEPSSLNKVRGEMQESKPIPAWIKTSAGWWSEEKVNDANLFRGIEFLIQNNIIEVPKTEPLSKPSRHIPDWLGNTAGWWSDGLIPDEAFIQSIQWLITNGVIVI